LFFLEAKDIVMQAASTYIFNQRQTETKRSWPYNKARLCAVARQPVVPPNGPEPRQ